MKFVFAQLRRKKVWILTTIILFFVVVLVVFIMSLPKNNTTHSVVEQIPSKSAQPDVHRAYFESTLHDLGLIDGIVYGSLILSPDKRFLVASAENKKTGAETFYFDFSQGIARSVMLDYLYGVPSFSAQYIAFPHNGIFLKDTATGEKISIANTAVVPERPLFSPNGRSLVFGTKNGLVLYTVVTKEKKNISHIGTDVPLYWSKNSASFLFSRTTNDQLYTLVRYDIQTNTEKIVGSPFKGKPIQLRVDENEKNAFMILRDGDTRLYEYLSLVDGSIVEIGRDDDATRGTVDYFKGTVMKKKECFVILYDTKGETQASLALPHQSDDVCSFAQLVDNTSVIYEVRHREGGSTMYRYEEGKRETVLFERTQEQDEFLFTLSADRKLLVLSRGDHFLFYSW